MKAYSATSCRRVHRIESCASGFGGEPLRMDMVKRQVESWILGCTDSHVYGWLALVSETAGYPVGTNSKLDCRLVSQL